MDYVHHKLNTQNQIHKTKKQPKEENTTTNNISIRGLWAFSEVVQISTRNIKARKLHADVQHEMRKD